MMLLMLPIVVLALIILWRREAFFVGIRRLMI